MKNTLYILIIVLFGSLALMNKANNDIWLHLKTGEVITAAHTIPRADIYSFTAGGHPWVNHSWLAEIIFFKTYEKFSVYGILILKALLIIAAACFCIAGCNVYKTNSLVVTFLLFIMAFSVWGRFIIRPHLFSYLFLSIYTYIFCFSKDKKGRLLYLLPVLQILWSNLHAGSVLGAGLVIVICLMEILSRRLSIAEGSFSLKGTGWQVLVSAAILTFIASFITPYGYHLYTYALSLGQSSLFSQLIYEWQSPFSSYYMGQFSFYFFLMWLFVSFTILYLRFKKKAFSDCFLLLIFLCLSLRAERYISVSMIILLPIIAKELSSIVRANSKNAIAAYNALRLIFSFCLLFLVIHVWANGLRAGRGYGVNRIEYRVGHGVPEQAVDFILEKDLPGEVWNSYSFGSYLVYRFYPERKVYIDGRILTYGEEIVENLFKLSDAKMDEIVRTYGIRTAIVSYNEDKALHRYFLRNGFKLVYHDKYAYVYVVNS